MVALRLVERSHYQLLSGQVGAGERQPPLASVGSRLLQASTARGGRLPAIDYNAT